MEINFSEGERTLVRELVSIQIQSYKELLRGEYSEECLETLAQYSYREEDLSTELRVRIEQYNDLYNEPLLIGILPDGELSILRHLLFHLEEELDDRNAINNLWDVFFYIERERNINLKLIETINLKDKKNNEIRMSVNSSRGTSDRPGIF